MKLVMAPILQCTDTEYQSEIVPLIKQLDAIDLCPHRNEKRNTTWNCNTFDDCESCPFCKANRKIIEALQIIKGIEVIK